MHHGFCNLAAIGQKINWVGRYDLAVCAKEMDIQFREDPDKWLEGYRLEPLQCLSGIWRANS
jgi:hypothetical protein